jgi:TetR/AcrR family transcriptional regulator, transcriptional repressor for nem operon
MGRVSDARERLLDAVNELTWQQGYNAVTVDAICERAGVKKGSFYHYFDSKADLTKAAIETRWQSFSHPLLEKTFAADIPPLERLKNYFAAIQHNQTELKKKSGRVLGCAFFCLAMDGGGLEEEVAELAQRYLQKKRRYFEAAIRDAKEQGLISIDDVEAATQAVYSLFEGANARARVQNNPDTLSDVYAQTLRLLGAVPAQGAPRRRTA